MNWIFYDVIRIYVYCHWFIEAYVHCTMYINVVHLFGYKFDNNFI